MSGDVSNVDVWADADVYVAPTGTADPASAATPFGVSWAHVGLLDGDAGFVETRNEDEDELTAWGGYELPTNARNFRLQVTFTAYELNSTTRDLIWPGSTETALVVPRPGLVRIALETRQDGRVRRKISTYAAKVKLDGDLVENESSPTSYPMVARIYGDPSTSPPQLWTVQDSALVSS